MSRPILEVIALDADDAIAARAGGADRLELVADMARDGLTPAPRTVAAVRDAVDLPVRVMLRSRDGFRTGGPRELDALCAAAGELRAEGAEEFVMGFLDEDGGPDLPALRALVAAIDGAPWTFHRAMDRAADRAALRAAVAELPGLDCHLTAGSPQGVDAGLPVLLAEAHPPGHPRRRRPPRRPPPGPAPRRPHRLPRRRRDPLQRLDHPHRPNRRPLLARGPGRPVEARPPHPRRGAGRRGGAVRLRAAAPPRPQGRGERCAQPTTGPAAGDRVVRGIPDRRPTACRRRPAGARGTARPAHHRPGAPEPGVRAPRPSPDRGAARRRRRGAGNGAPSPPPARRPGTGREGHAGPSPGRGAARRRRRGAGNGAASPPPARRSGTDREGHPGPLPDPVPRRGQPTTGPAARNRAAGGHPDRSRPRRRAPGATSTPQANPPRGGL